MTTMQISTPPNKSIIITGANSGLGYYCAEAIAASQQNWHIIIASRDASRVEASVDRLRKETEYPYIEGMTIDLASLASIRQFAEHNKAINRPPLEAIVCNAGIQIVSDTLYTEDGFEMTFGVNHLGHFLLVNLLLPQLSTGSRIVFVSSDTHNPKANTGMPEPQYQTAEHLAFSNNNSDDDIGNIGRTRYTTSKLCNILACYELSRRLHSSTVEDYSQCFQPRLNARYEVSPRLQSSRTLRFKYNDFTVCSRESKGL